MAKIAGCSKRSITHNYRNLWLFNSVSLPLIYAGHLRSIILLMLDALYNRLTEKPGLYVEEMVIFFKG
jgi:hypothetical protein